MMRRLFAVFVILGLCLTALPVHAQAPATTEKPKLDTVRLKRVYSLLKGAELLTTGAPLPTEDEIARLSANVPDDKLPSECAKVIAQLQKAMPSMPKRNYVQVFGFTKNAAMRLRYDREEPRRGHEEWADKNKDKVSAAVREDLRNTLEMLGQK